jgi:hypothetical protein
MVFNADTHWIFESLGRKQSNKSNVAFVNKLLISIIGYSRHRLVIAVGACIDVDDDDVRKKTERAEQAEADPAAWGLAKMHMTKCRSYVVT